MFFLNYLNFVEYLIAVDIGSIIRHYLKLYQNING